MNNTSVCHKLIVNLRQILWYFSEWFELYLVKLLLCLHIADLQSIPVGKPILQIESPTRVLV